MFACIISAAILYYLPIWQTMMYPWLKSFAEEEWLMFFIVHTTIVPAGLTLGYIVNWFVYRLEHPFFERYKITSEPWPWYDNPKEWYSLVWETIFAVSVTQFVVNPILILLALWGDNWVPQVNTSTTEYPDRTTMCFHLFICMFCEDFFFYWFHRLLHWKPLYQAIHKKHHKHKQPVGIVAAYAHPLESVLNIIAFSTGQIVLKKKMHHFTYIVWVLYRMFETVDGHSGYEFSFSPFRLLPLSAGA